MIARVLVNGAPADSVSAMDRGLAYGDGLFESIRFCGREAPLWQRHMQRLQESCRRLRMPPPDPLQLLDEARRVAHELPHCVVRVTVTRGVAERGYAPPASPQLTRIVASFAPPPAANGNDRQGIRMRLCDVRLAEQPLLAGMKHLNRLEQVLARAEWSDPAIAEGVLCDRHGRVISATMANLFAMIDGVVITPSVDLCGVAGIARAEVLAACPQARVGELSMDALLGASEVFLSSSVRGILPVRSVESSNYVPGTITRNLQQHWRSLGFSMEQGG
jgi:4-amino-4-deoxychorismate lyase